MPIGIDPKDDFAFKLVLGSPDHTRVTIHFLNAVLQFPDPITSVEILNPLQDKDRSEDKLVVLDVLARDAMARRFNVEMQTTLPLDLTKRLTYYNCLNLVRQLTAGEPYYNLRPAISICVLDRRLFPKIADVHLSFRLRCDQRDLVFGDDLVFHTLELPKYKPTADNRPPQTPLEKWLYFLTQAEHSDASDLTAQLQDEEFREAAGVLEMISQSPEDRQFYEARMKFLHDQEARLLAARQEGLEKGRGEGREEGALVGQIRLLQRLLGQEETEFQELLRRDWEELSAQLAELEGQFVPPESRQ